MDPEGNAPLEGKNLRALGDRFPFPRLFYGSNAVFTDGVCSLTKWTHWKNISQIGSFLQVRLNIKNV